MIKKLFYTNSKETLFFKPKNAESLNQFVLEFSLQIYLWYVPSESTQHFYKLSKQLFHPFGQKATIELLFGCSSLTSLLSTAGPAASLYLPLNFVSPLSLLGGISIYCLQVKCKIHRESRCLGWV